MPTDGVWAYHMMLPEAEETSEPLLKRLEREIDSLVISVGQAKDLPPGATKQTINISTIHSLQLYFGKQGADVPDHLSAAKGLFYLMICSIFILALAFILAGLGLVYLGASGSSQIDAFGLKMASTNVGIISIGFGALVLIVCITKAMHHIQEILKLHRNP